MVYNPYLNLHFSHFHWSNQARLVSCFECVQLRKRANVSVTITGVQSLSQSTFFSYQVPELSAELKRHGLSNSGGKASLVDRLVKYDTFCFMMLLLSCHASLLESLLNVTKSHEPFHEHCRYVAYELVKDANSKAGLDDPDDPANRQNNGNFVFIVPYLHGVFPLQFICRNGRFITL